MPTTVTVDAEKYERLRRGGEHAYHSCMSRADGWMCTYPEIRPGDLDPIEPDPEPSVEAMLRELLDMRRVVCMEPLDIAPLNIQVSIEPSVFSDPEFIRSAESYDVADALRAAYRQMVVGGE